MNFLNIFKVFANVFFFFIYITRINSSMVNPCLGDLHTAEDKDQNNQTVVDFLLIDSTFAMEVT
jgi:hypothetical protein